MFIVVLGGSGSGKSEFAESLTLKFNKGLKFYIATMQPFDDESYKKIERHRKMRKDKNFETIECQTHLENVKAAKDSTVLLECISNLTANEMYSDEGSKDKTVENVIEGLKILKKETKNLVVVTNNIFEDGNSFDDDTVRYLKYLADINKEMCEMSDAVYEVVHGISIKIKG